MASTVFAHEPVDYVTRCCPIRFPPQRISVQRPSVVPLHKNLVSGVQRMDHHITELRIGVRQKKWWWSIFTWGIDVAIQNAWHLYCHTGWKMSLFEFRRALAEHYCGIGTNEAHSVSTSLVYAHVGPRSSRIEHMPEICNKGPCAHPDCKKLTRCRCETCKVRLCIECYAPYHVQPDQY